MKRVLITGISGFVGSYLSNELESEGYEIFGISTKKSTDNKNIFVADITDYEAIFNIIDKVRPDQIYNLAAVSSISMSEEDKNLTFDVNFKGPKNILEAILKLGLETRVLLVSTSQVYGKVIYLPIDENHPLNPTNTYARSKLEQESLLDYYDGLNIAIVRSFNHTGPGQTEAFVLPNFARQIIAMKNGVQSNELVVGNLSVKRDFTDVRDIVKAYRLILENGATGIYNVCSGKSHKLKILLDEMLKIAGVNAVIKTDDGLFRENENPDLYGSFEKLRKVTGWEPTIKMDQTLKDILGYWQSIS